MANYHLMVKTQLSEEWLRCFNSFHEELGKAGCKIQPNGTLEATDKEAEVVMSLAEKNRISLYLKKL